METPLATCQHRWSYFVDVAAGAVRTRRCDLCGERMPLFAPSRPEPVSAA